MTLDCTIDGKSLSLSVNSNKPLLQILSEDVGNQTINSNCHGEGCGNCIVMVNGQAVLACLVPAFRLKDARIITFEGFSKTRQYHDIERAYEESGNRPCPNCYAARTLLIESILQNMTGAHHYGQLVSVGEMSGVIGAQDINEALVRQELAFNKCDCMDTGELLGIVRIALGYRRRPNVRRA